MPNTLKITRLQNDFFEFVLNNDNADKVTNLRNDLTVVDGNEFHFKTENGANIIKNQQIYPSDITVVVDGVSFTFTSVQSVLNKLIEVRFFDWMKGVPSGNPGTNRFDQLLDTFSYVGNNAKIVVVNESQQKLEPKAYSEIGVTRIGQLLDVPDTIEPNKMLVGNSDGTSTVWRTVPSEPQPAINSVGYFIYENTGPLQYINVDGGFNLINNGNGSRTNLQNTPYGVSKIIDFETGVFDFSQLSIGDTVEVRIDFTFQSTVVDQELQIQTLIAPSTSSVLLNEVYRHKFPVIGSYPLLSTEFSFAISSNDVKNSTTSRINAKTFDSLPGGTNQSAFIKANSYYIRIIRKSLNLYNITGGGDGSETKIINGTNTTVLGNGTIGSPYRINASSSSQNLQQVLDSGKVATYNNTSSQVDGSIEILSGIENNKTVKFDLYNNQTSDQRAADLIGTPDGIRIRSTRSTGSANTSQFNVSDAPTITRINGAGTINVTIPPPTATSTLSFPANKVGSQTIAMLSDITTGTSVPRKHCVDFNRYFSLVNPNWYVSNNITTVAITTDSGTQNLITALSGIAFGNQVCNAPYNMMLKRIVYHGRAASAFIIGIVKGDITASGTMTNVVTLYEEPAFSSNPNRIIDVNNNITIEAGKNLRLSIRQGVTGNANDSATYTLYFEEVI